MKADYKFPTIVVDEYTSPIEGFVGPKMTIPECYKVLQDKGYRHLPVMDGDRAVGIVSQRDLNLFLNYSGAENVCVEVIMVKEPFVVDYSDPIEKVALALSSRKIGSALVRDQNAKITGIFTTTDAMNALIEILRG